MLKKVSLALLLFSSFAFADSFFWAINQFTNVQQLDGDTGAVVQNWTISGGPSGRYASIAVIGNTGYFTDLDNGTGAVYKVDMTTHAYGGVAFLSGDTTWINGITVDEQGHLWMAYGGTEQLREFDTAGNLLGKWTFPDAAAAFRDGSTVNNGILVANRGDQIGPYDEYKIGAPNTTLTYIAHPFITALGGNNGVAFNGANYYVSNEQTHIVTKYDASGAFVSQANLPANSRYENWTFAQQDIINAPVPEPSAIILLGTIALGLVPVLRKRTARS
jgi:hypothetical protein